MKKDICSILVFLLINSSECLVTYKPLNNSEYGVVMTRSMPEVGNIVGLAIKEMDPDAYWIDSLFNDEPNLQVHL